MLQRLKNRIVTLLGGLTVEEAKTSNRNSYDIGIYSTYVSILRFADGLNGKPADEWCKLMYEHLRKSIIAKEKTYSPDE